MNILLINQYAGSLWHGMEYRPFYLAREWTRSGHRVTIVAASFSHVRAQAPRLTSSCTIEEIEGIRYVWLKTPSYSGNGFKRAVNMFTFVFQLYRFRSQITEDFIPDVVVASSTHPLDIFPARAIAIRFGARLVFEVHDLWPLSPIELGGMSQHNPFIIAIQTAEDYAYRHADTVVSMLPCAEGYMKSRGLDEGRFIHIPNGIDAQEWVSPRGLTGELAERLEALRREGHFLVAYTGAHGVANALHTVIDCADTMRDKPVRFVLVGQGPVRETLLQEVKKKKLNNVLMLPSIEKSMIPAFLHSMDALYIGLQNQSLFRFGVSPNKLLDYMMAAKPIIQAVNAGNDIVRDAGCGITIEPENHHELARAVAQLMSTTPTERQEMGNRGHEFVLENHNYRNLAQRFIEAVNGKPALNDKAKRISFAETFGVST